MMEIKSITKKKYYNEKKNRIVFDSFLFCLCQNKWDERKFNAKMNETILYPSSRFQFHKQNEILCGLTVL